MYLPEPNPIITKDYSFLDADPNAKAQPSTGQTLSSKFTCLKDYETISKNQLY